MKKIAFFLVLVIPGFIEIMAQAPVSPNAPANKSFRNALPLTAVLGAFADEVNILEARVQQKKVHVIQGIHFTEGSLNGRKVVIAQTGIGKVNAAITTTLMLDHFKPQQLIFTGIAGGVNPELSPGDIVISTLVAYHDYGTLTPDSMLSRATRNPWSMIENPIYFPADSSLIVLAEQAAKNLLLETVPRQNTQLPPKIIKGVIVTGDVFVSSVVATQMLRRKMKAEATEMEGAAVAQACWQQQVPFVVIRSLSDNAGDDAYDDVKKFYQVAARNSAGLVMSMLVKLASKR